MNIKFEESDLNLKPIEKEIVISIIKKKGFIGSNNIHFSKNYFNSARISNLKKKTEDGLKFVFIKAIQELRKEFKKIHFPLKSKIKGNELDKVFYKHYYGQISKELNVPIESFFHFRNWKQRFSPFIPKSITKEYMERLNFNSEFIKKLKNFLNNKLLNSFKVTNSKKIRRMIIKWEKIIQENGSYNGLKKIKKQINSRGNKFPWTLSEVHHALKETLNSIDGK